MNTKTRYTMDPTLVLECTLRKPWVRLINTVQEGERD